MAVNWPPVPNLWPKNYIQPVSHLTDKMMTFHSCTVPTHHSTTGRMSWRSLLLPGILVPKNGTMCHAPRGYSWVNLVISVNCDMRIILLLVHGVVSFAYLLKWKCTSLLNWCHPLRIFLTWTIHKIELSDLYYLHILLVQNISYMDEICDVGLFSVLMPLEVHFQMQVCHVISELWWHH